MIKNIIKTLVFFVSVFLTSTGIAQPFIDEVKAFKKQDSIEAPPKHEIVFIGSSSFRKWTDVQSYFPNHTIINRGFGGSTFPDLIRYVDDLVFPYEPKQIVIYCGDNDLAASDTINADSVFNRFKKFYDIIRSKARKANIVFVAIKPSPSREKLMPKMDLANYKIKQFLSADKSAAFADVYHPMLNADGKPMPDIFEDDNLHMNAKGYAIWQKVLEPYLK